MNRTTALVLFALLIGTSSATAQANDTTTLYLVDEESRHTTAITTTIEIPTHGWSNYTMTAWLPDHVDAIVGVQTSTYEEQSLDLTAVGTMADRLAGRQEWTITTRAFDIEWQNVSSIRLFITYTDDTPLRQAPLPLFVPGQAIQVYIRTGQGPPSEHLGESFSLSNPGHGDDTFTTGRFLVPSLATQADAAILWPTEPHWRPDAASVLVGVLVGSISVLVPTIVVLRRRSTSNSS